MRSGEYQDLTRKENTKISDSTSATRKARKTDLDAGVEIGSNFYCHRVHGSPRAATIAAISRGLDHISAQASNDPLMTGAAGLVRNMIAEAITAAWHGLGCQVAMDYARRSVATCLVAGCIGFDSFMLGRKTAVMFCRTSAGEHLLCALNETPMVELETFGMMALEIHAAHLNAICVPERNAAISYDILADALIWSDETGKSTPIDVIHALRQLRHYRTHVILHDIEPDNDVWRYCHFLFPDWIGFLSERRKPTPELLAEYRRGDIFTKWCLRNFEREMDAVGT